MNGERWRNTERRKPEEMEQNRRLGPRQCGQPGTGETAATMDGEKGLHSRRRAGDPWSAVPSEEVPRVVTPLT